MPPRERRPGRRQQPGQRGAADLADQLVDVGGEAQLAALPKAVEEFGHEGVEPMGADPPARLPQDLGGAGDGRAVLPRAAARPGCRPGPRRAAQQPDGRLAVEAGHGHHFVQEPMLLGARGVLIPLALFGRVLSPARSRHGHFLGGFGNPGF
jgi:hypothetical protein